LSTFRLNRRFPGTARCSEGQPVGIRTQRATLGKYKIIPGILKCKQTELRSKNFTKNESVYKNGS